jgi:hypothetical protein
LRVVFYRIIPVTGQESTGYSAWTHEKKTCEAIASKGYRGFFSEKVEKQKKTAKIVQKIRQFRRGIKKLKNSKK